MPSAAGMTQLGNSVLAASLRAYAVGVFAPAQALQRSGMAVVPPPEGDFPEALSRPGLGASFSLRHRQPVLIEKPTDHDDLVVEFDRLSEVYDAYVAPFSRPLFAAALTVLSRYLTTDARIMDAGCGPGRELQEMARRVPQGEVVGVDLAAGMVLSAQRSAYAHGVDNVAFFQADVGDLPEMFSGQFDVIYNSLAHHHYPEPQDAAENVMRCLRPGGLYGVIDPGPAWFNRIASPWAKWGDPGWIGFHTPEQFRELFRRAGFQRTSWTELLPGFGLALAQKAFA